MYFSMFCSRAEIICVHQLLGERFYRALVICYIHFSSIQSFLLPILHNFIDEQQQQKKRAGCIYRSAYLIYSDWHLHQCKLCIHNRGWWPVLWRFFLFLIFVFSVYGLFRLTCDKIAFDIPSVDKFGEERAYKNVYISCI